MQSHKRVSYEKEEKWKSREKQALEFVEKIYNSFKKDIEKLQSGEEMECIANADNILVDILNDVADLMKQKT